jgi:hypothetical protein
LEQDIITLDMADEIHVTNVLHSLNVPQEVFIEIEDDPEEREAIQNAERSEFDRVTEVLT